MAMIRFNPMWEMQNMAKDINKFMQNNFTGENRPRVEIGEFKPRIDVIEDDKALLFEIEIPGVNKDDVKVSINDENILIIKGEKKFNKKDDVKFCCRSERSYGQFNRSFQLPENVDAEKISARYENGVLTLTVPKMEPVQPKEKLVTIS